MEPSNKRRISSKTTPARIVIDCGPLPGSRDASSEETPLNAFGSCTIAPCRDAVGRRGGPVIGIVVAASVARFGRAA